MILTYMLEILRDIDYLIRIGTYECVLRALRVTYLL